MKKRKDNLIKCLLALLCLARIFMPAAIMADDDNEGDVVVTIHTDIVSIDAAMTDVTATDIGDIHVENDHDSDNTKGYALDVSASDGHTATVGTGTVELSKDSKEIGYYYGVNIDADDGGHAIVTTKNVDVNGMKNEGDTVTGVHVDVDAMFEGGSSAVVTVEGDVTVNNGTTMPEETGLDVYTRAGFSSDKTASTKVEVEGNIAVSNGDAISASSTMSGSSTKIESGNITTAYGYGVSGKATLGETEITTGNIDVITGIGANAYAIGQANTTINSKNITVDGGTGIVAEAKNNGNVSVTANKVNVIGENSVGIDIKTSNNVDSKDSSAIPQELIDALEERLKRPLNQEELEYLASSMADAKGNENVSVVVNGDVKADTGIKLDVTNGGLVDILINGTLKANKPVSLAESVDLTNSSLTLWKIEQSEEAPTPADLLINYIIRIDQDEEGIFEVIKADGTSLDTKDEFNIANLNDALQLKIKNGYTITKAYNNGVELEKDEQGRYILNVPYGGGIKFSIDYEKTEPGPEPTPTPDEKPDESSPSDSDKGEQIVIRFVPPTTGIDAPINKTSMTKKGILYALDALIVSLALLSFNRRRSDRQFVKNVM